MRKHVVIHNTGSTMHCRQRMTQPRPQVTRRPTEYFVNFGLAAFELREWTDIPKDRQTRCSQYVSYPSPGQSNNNNTSSLYLFMYSLMIKMRQVKESAPVGDVMSVLVVSLQVRREVGASLTCRLFVQLYGTFFQLRPAKHQYYLLLITNIL